MDQMPLCFTKNLLLYHYQRLRNTHWLDGSVHWNVALMANLKIRDPNSNPRAMPLNLKQARDPQPRRPLP